MVGRNGLFSGYKSQRTKGKMRRPWTAENKNSQSRTKKNGGSIQGEITIKHWGADKQKPRKTEGGNHRTGGRIEKTFVPLFLLKETEEATKRGHEQRRKKAASPPVLQPFSASLLPERK
jgi:hypothetical protein